MTDMLQSTFDEGLRRAFMDYFAELGVTVRRWDALFDELDRADNTILVRRDDAGTIVGFALLTCREMSGGFYAASVGSVDELYVAPDHRGQGHGRGLLAAAENHLRRLGCGFVLLTSDTAGDFYRRCGYRREPRIHAKNSDPVFVKALEPAARM